MQFSSFQSMLTTLLASFFDEATTGCWFIGNQQTNFLFGQDIVPCTIEETVVLKKLINEQKSAEFELSRTSVLRKLHTFITNHNFHKINLLTGEVLLIASWQQADVLVIFERVLKQQLADLAKRQHILQLFDNESTKNNLLFNENTQLKAHRKNELLLLMNQWEKKHSPIRIQFDHSFIQKIDLLSSNDTIINQLNAALELIQYLKPGLLEYRLNESFFTSNESAQQIVNHKINSPINATRNRSELLLDKYEEAAQIALANNQVVNGRTIAAYLQPSVSPPAITDALKKNRKAIKSLLDENPTKWGLLRNYLKPVKNISEASNYAIHAGFN